MFIIRTFVFIIRTRRKFRLLYNRIDKVHFGKAETGKSASTFGKSYPPNVAHEATKKHQTICKIWIAS